MESEDKELILGQLMYLLGIEGMYNCKLYHYINDMGIDPIECEDNDIDLKELNKHEFGLLKRINFDSLTLRTIIEEEQERREVYAKTIKQR